MRRHRDSRRRSRPVHDAQLAAEQRARAAISSRPLGPIESSYTRPQVSEGASRAGCRDRTDDIRFPSWLGRRPLVTVGVHPSLEQVLDCPRTVTEVHVRPATWLPTWLPFSNGFSRCPLANPYGQPAHRDTISLARSKARASASLGRTGRSSASSKSSKRAAGTVVCPSCSRKARSVASRSSSDTGPEYVRPLSTRAVSAPSAPATVEPWT